MVRIGLLGMLLVAKISGGGNTMNANVVMGVHVQTVVQRSIVQAEQEDRFMSEYVSPYFLPKRLTAARKRGAVKLAVPVETLEKLIAAVTAARLKGTGSVQVGVASLETYLSELGKAA